MTDYRLHVTDEEAALFGGIEPMLISRLAAASDDSEGDGPYYWTHTGIEACARLFRRFADHAQGLDQ